MHRRSLPKNLPSILLAGNLIFFLFVISAPQAGAQSDALTFAVIGDYGVNDEYEAAVASMVNGWNPDLVLALGDAYYADAGGAGSEKYDLSTGQYYCAFLKDVTTTGSFCPAGEASINRFFPALGDHDYADAGMTGSLPSTYTDYFSLPGDGYTSSSNNERYYDFVSGPVHFFVLNSLDAPGYEPDGTTSSSVQAEWLRTQLGASTSTWNVVVAHTPPYSSGTKHGSTVRMQWPFAQWGADVVLSGDEHNYERILHDGIAYFVNGLGGAWPYPFGEPIEGSMFRYNASNGAQRVIATDASLTVEFYSVENGGTLQDTYTITVPHNTATPTLPSNSSGWQSPTRQAAASGAGDNNGYEISPTHAFADDGLAAMDIDSGTNASTSCTDPGKDKHRFSNFNIPIPAGAVVQGIQVRLDANADATVGAPKLCVSLSWDNGVSWSAWKNTPTLTDWQETYLVGGTSDTWGRTWTAAELGNSSFQVRVADIAGDNNRDFSLGWVAVNVVYGLASTATASPTASATPSPSDTVTATTTATPTSTLTATDTPTHTPTHTATSTAVDTQTHTPTATPTHTLTPASTSTATSTPTLSIIVPVFSDVFTEHWSWGYIERLYRAGITGGCGTSPLMYCPEATVTRAQMAVFLERSIHGAFYMPPALGNGTGFSDVPISHWAAGWIKQFALDGITAGCGPVTFCPEGPVTRAQMSVFLLKARHGVSYTPPAVGSDTGFVDVPFDYWSAAWIKQLVTEGITAGCGSGNYCPEAPVTRAQMAVFLVKTFSLP